jgi:hypothetical protein
MGKTKSQSTSLNKTPNRPVHPILNDWSINQKLEKLEQDYRADQEKGPVVAISYRVERLRQYADEIKGAYEAEITAGRAADTPGLWVEIYKQILASLTPKINSLVGNLALKLWRTGGGEPGEQATVEEGQRELSRLRADLERKLANACECAERAKAPENEQSTPDSELREAKARNERESVVGPLLQIKGWSTNDWATHSGVDFHTADNYRKGKAKSYPSTLQKLAASLGIECLPS